MAVRKSTPKSSTQINDQKVSESKKITIPFPKSFNIIYVLGLLLIVAAFLLGMLYTKVQYLENGGTTITADEDDLTAGDEPITPVDVENGKLPGMGSAVFNNPEKPSEQKEKLQIVVFSDFQCPFCKAFWEDALVQIKKDYIATGKAEFFFRHFPLKEIHPNAQKAAEASECANEQGNFWGYHDELFKNQADWEAITESEAIIKFSEYANNLGLNGATLTDCINSGRMKEKVDTDLSAGQTAGVDGTPATFINGMLVSGAAPYEDFKVEIERQLTEINN